MAGASGTQAPGISAWDRIPEDELKARISVGRQARHQSEVMLSKMDAMLRFKACGAIMSLVGSQKQKAMNAAVQALLTKVPREAIHALTEYNDGNVLVQFKDTDAGRDACAQVHRNLTHVTVSADQSGLGPGTQNIQVPIGRHYHQCAAGSVRVTLTVPPSGFFAHPDAGRIIISCSDYYKDRLDLSTAVTEAFHAPSKLDPAMSDGSRLIFYVTPPPGDPNLSRLPRSFMCHAGSFKVHINVHTTRQAMEGDVAASPPVRPTTVEQRLQRQLQEVTPERRAAHKAASEAVARLSEKRPTGERAGIGHTHRAAKRLNGGGLLDTHIATAGGDTAHLSATTNIGVDDPAPMEIDSTDTDTMLPLPPTDTGASGGISALSQAHDPPTPPRASHASNAPIPPAPNPPPPPHPPPPPPNPLPPPPPPPHPPPPPPNPPPPPPNPLPPPPPRGAPLQQLTAHGQPCAKPIMASTKQQAHAAPSRSGGEMEMHPSTRGLAAGLMEWLRDRHEELHDSGERDIMVSAILEEANRVHHDKLHALVSKNGEFTLAELPGWIITSANKVMAANGFASTSYDVDGEEEDRGKATTQHHTDRRWQRVGQRHQRKQKPATASTIKDSGKKTSNHQNKPKPSTAAHGPPPRLTAPQAGLAGREHLHRTARDPAAKTAPFHTRVDSLRSTVLSNAAQTPPPGHGRRGGR